jgi:hypothetical protein
MPTIHTKIEAARGCGYRKGGGIYLVAGKLGFPCGKLPIPLVVCPCCNQGIKATRGFTWVSGQLIKEAQCSRAGEAGENCIGCGKAYSQERYGLLWVGEKFYATPGAFAAEAVAQGISRRISAIPRDFKVGETWILLGHRKAVKGTAVVDAGDSPVETVEEWFPGVFQIFLPERIEYVVKGTETDEELEALEKRGLTLVKVIRDIDVPKKVEEA